MNIYGYNSSSEAGPDKFAVSVFLDGCNLRCPYCMNSQLVNRVLPNLNEDSLTEAIIRINPSMVFISGGEPTYDMDNLKETIDWLKKINVKIGLSTNGTYSERLKELIVDNKISYVTMDLKGHPDSYCKPNCDCSLCNTANTNQNNFFNVLNSWRILRESGISYEIRTTLYPKTINGGVINYLSGFFIGGEKWILQQFRICYNMLGQEASNVVPYDNKEIERLFEIAKKLSGANVELRYV